MFGRARVRCKGFGLVETGLSELLRSLLGRAACGVLLHLGVSGGGRVLALPLLVGRGLLLLGLGARCGLLFGRVAAGLEQALLGTLPLGVRDGLVGDGFLAVVGLDLLELPLLHQMVLTAH